MVRRAITVHSAVLALVVGLSVGNLGLAQAPGQPAPPPKTKEAKLKQVKEAYQPIIDWSKASIEPGEADQRLKEFLQKTLNTERHNGIIKVGKTSYMIATGEVTLESEAKVGWLQKRILGLGEAELRARAQMAQSIQESITARIIEKFDCISV